MQSSTSLYLDYSFSYTSPTALGIRQEVKQIMANVFYSTFFKNFCHVFMFIFLERFLHLCFRL